MTLSVDTFFCSNHKRDTSLSKVLVVSVVSCGGKWTSQHLTATTNHTKKMKGDRMTTTTTLTLASSKVKQQTYRVQEIKHSWVLNVLFVVPIKDDMKVKNRYCTAVHTGFMGGKLTIIM